MCVCACASGHVSVYMLCMHACLCDPRPLKAFSRTNWPMAFKISTCIQYLGLIDSHDDPRLILALLAQKLDFLVLLYRQMLKH